MGVVLLLCWAARSAEAADFAGVVGCGAACVAGARLRLAVRDIAAESRGFGLAGGLRRPDCGLGAALLAALVAAVDFSAVDASILPVRCWSG
jgi:hypothetical protein